MKSFRTTGLILIVSLSWAVSAAKAQYDENRTPTLLPLPDAAPVLTAPPVANIKALEPYRSAFTSSQLAPAATPAPADPAPAGPMALGTANVDAGDPALWDDCGCNSCNNGGWFTYLGALAMTRNRANPYWTTYQTNNNPNQLMNTQNAGSGWAAGGQVTAGYAFGSYTGCGGQCGNAIACGTADACGQCGGCLGPAIAFTYWGLGPMTGFSRTVDPTNNINTALSTPIDLGGVNINGNPAGGYFDNAHEQRIWRTDRFNNFEVNLFQGTLFNTGRLQVAALAGFRYFRFAENLTYGSVAFGHNFGDNGGADEAYLSFKCVNNLFGGQLGAVFNYALTDRFGLFFIPKAGIFGNQMNCQTLLYSGDQVNNPTYNIAANKSDVSFLGELDSGFNWAWTDNLRLYFGYRVVGIANLALADNQFLPFLADTAGFAQVKQNGGMILHGALAGFVWTF
jgi:hypothetical protein